MCLQHHIGKYHIYVKLCVYYIRSDMLATCCWNLLCESLTFRTKMRTLVWMTPTVTVPRECLNLVLFVILHILETNQDNKTTLICFVFLLFLSACVLPFFPIQKAGFGMFDHVMTCVKLSGWRSCMKAAGEDCLRIFWLCTLNLYVHLLICL